MAEIDELYRSEGAGRRPPTSPPCARRSRRSSADRGQEPSPDSFVSRYLEILQNEPDVVMLHATLRRALDRSASPERRGGV